MKNEVQKSLAAPSFGQCPLRNHSRSSSGYLQYTIKPAEVSPTKILNNGAAKETVESVDTDILEGITETDERPYHPESHDFHQKISHVLARHPIKNSNTKQSPHAHNDPQNNQTAYNLAFRVSKPSVHSPKTKQISATFSPIISTSNKKTMTSLSEVKTTLTPNNTQSLLSDQISPLQQHRMQPQSYFEIKQALQFTPQSNKLADDKVKRTKPLLSKETFTETHEYTKQQSPATITKPSNNTKHQRPKPEIDIDSSSKDGISDELASGLSPLSTHNLDMSMVLRRINAFQESLNTNAQIEIVCSNQTLASQPTQQPRSTTTSSIPGVDTPVHINKISLNVNNMASSKHVIPFLEFKDDPSTCRTAIDGQETNKESQVQVTSHTINNLCLTTPSLTAQSGKPTLDLSSPSHRIPLRLDNYLMMAPPTHHQAQFAKERGLFVDCYEKQSEKSDDSKMLNFIKPAHSNRQETYTQSVNNETQQQQKQQHSVEIKDKVLNLRLQLEQANLQARRIEKEREFIQSLASIQAKKAEQQAEISQVIKSIQQSPVRNTNTCENALRTKDKPLEPSAIQRRNNSTHVTTCGAVSPLFFKKPDNVQSSQSQLSILGNSFVDQKNKQQGTPIVSSDISYNPSFVGSPRKITISNGTPSSISSSPSTSMASFMVVKGTKASELKRRVSTEKLKREHEAEQHKKARFLAKQEVLSRLVQEKQQKMVGGISKVLINLESKESPVSSHKVANGRQRVQSQIVMSQSPLDFSNTTPQKNNSPDNSHLLDETNSTRQTPTVTPVKCENQSEEYSIPSRTPSQHPLTPTPAASSTKAEIEQTSTARKRPNSNSASVHTAYISLQKEQSQHHHTQSQAIPNRTENKQAQLHQSIHYNDIQFIRINIHPSSTQKTLRSLLTQTPSICKKEEPTSPFHLSEEQSTEQQTQIHSQQRTKHVSVCLSNRGNDQTRKANDQQQPLVQAAVSAVFTSIDACNSEILLLLESPQIK